MDYKVQKNSQNNDMASLVNDVCNIIETGRKEAYSAAGKSAVITSWNIGRRIVEEKQQVLITYKNITVDNTEREITESPC